MKLNLGCGLKYKKGWVNLDFNEKLNPDVVHNLSVFPYPFADNTFDYVLMDNVLEHLENTIKVMEELHRISKPNAIITIIVPHFSAHGSMTHLTHKKIFGTGSFDNFKPNQWEKYSKAEFEILETKLDWFNYRNWFGLKTLNKIVNKIINWNLFLTERFLYFFVCGIGELKFKLKVIK